jgi:hypothetical protein
MDAKDKRYKYDRFGMKGARVGQAVVDILSKDQPDTTVGDIMGEYGKDFVKQFEEAVETGSKLYESPFYIFVLSAKEMWAVNMVRSWFIPRQTPPYASDMMVEHPNKTKTLYMIDYKNGKAGLLWTVPSIQECATVEANADLYHPDLVKWCSQCLKGTMDKDSYQLSEVS